MAIFIVLLLWDFMWTTVHVQAVTPQPKYQIPVKVVDMNAPEDWNLHYVPLLSTQWSEVKPGSKFQAHLFAGKAEFPYVVRIKGKEYAPCEDPADAQYNEAMGVLVTANIVLTACRPISYLDCTEKDKDKWEEWPTKEDPLPNPFTYVDVPIFPGSDKVNLKTLQCPNNKLRITPCAPHILEVRYATVFLHEDNKHTDMFGYFSRDFENKYCGVRSVAEVLLHPECKPWFQLPKDVGLLILTAPINPAGTWIGMVTFPLNAQGHIEYEPLENKVLTGEEVCHIAGFNEDYAGLLGDDQITRHFKVKFRAYQTSLKVCREFVKIICFDKIVALLKGCYEWLKWMDSPYGSKPEEFGVECWETRHKVGAVCNTHAGSPLVCNGFMHGYVIRGADWKRCSVMWNMPFLVQRVAPLEDFFNHQLLQHVLPSDQESGLFSPISQSEPYHHRSASPHHPGNRLLLLVYTYLQVFVKNK